MTHTSSAIDTSGGNYKKVGDRLVARHPAGFIISLPTDYTRMPVSCPVCDMLMQTADDASAFWTHECCSDCLVTWVEVDKDRWSAGWRPSRDDVIARIAGQ